MEKNKSDLAKSIQELYENSISYSEVQTAKRYLIDFFQILQKVDSRLQKQSNKNNDAEVKSFENK